MTEETASAPSEKDSAGRSSPPAFDVARTLTFFFEDPQWIAKLAVGSLFALLSPFLIGTVFMTGFAIAVARRVRDGEPHLPEWDDFQAIFLDGLRGILLSLAHKIPLLLLGLLMTLALVGGVFLGRAEGTIPDKFAFLGLPALFGGFVIVFLLSVVVIVYVPSAFVRFVQTDRLAAAFDFSANVEFIRRNFSAYLLGLLAIVLAGLLAQLGFLFFCIGIFPAIFWSICVMGHVVGELSRRPDPTAPESETATAS
jgi:hypothetical protein